MAARLAYVTLIVGLEITPESGHLLASAPLTVPAAATTAVFVRTASFPPAATQPGSPSNPAAIVQLAAEEVQAAVLSPPAAGPGSQGSAAGPGSEWASLNMPPGLPPVLPWRPAGPSPPSPEP
ncbi:hypothetical protein HaLaN_02570 [Haematococcus lacustris]|uniref:Uncharacterized protein n=1 Tax=Haematococcus lacustris TaxID=44745 RepID=A0A699YIL3_HAELA|nr:hypothetical protein HaLaN_02570 [Haematococcus lacustris]